MSGGYGPAGAVALGNFGGANAGTALHGAEVNGYINPFQRILGMIGIFASFLHLFLLLLILLRVNKTNDKIKSKDDKTRTHEDIHEEKLSEIVKKRWNQKKWILYIAFIFSMITMIITIVI